MFCFKGSDIWSENLLVCSINVRIVLSKMYQLNIANIKDPILSFYIWSNLSRDDIDIEASEVAPTVRNYL